MARKRRKVRTRLCRDCKKRIKRHQLVTYYDADSNRIRLCVSCRDGRYEKDANSEPRKANFDNIADFHSLRRDWIEDESLHASVRQADKTDIQSAEQITGKVNIKKNRYDFTKGFQPKDADVALRSCWVNVDDLPAEMVQDLEDEWAAENPDSLED